MRKQKFAPLLAVLLILSACSNTNTAKGSDDTASVSAEEIADATGEVFAMDTYMTVTAYGEQCNEAVSAAIEEIERLDSLLSVGNADSEISYINTHGKGTLSEDTLTMVQESLTLWETTGGAFDITVYPLMDLWGFTTGNFSVPDDDELKTILDLSGSEKLTLDTDTSVLTLGNGQGIDLGGIAKGYTSGRVMDIFEEYGIVSGVVSLGGNVHCYGTKTDGSLWRVGIQNPLDTDSDNSYLGIVTVSDKAVITSGAYERYFIDESTGETYHHIIDPDTGYPADSGLISVTVVSDNGMLADGLSTSCYVMGLEESTEYWRTYGDDFDLILMTENKEVYVTQGIADNFTSDFTVYTIER